jgi:hypothetical protein
MCVGAVRSSRELVDKATPSSGEELNSKDVSVTIGGLFAYVAVFQWLGFIISTTWLIFGLATYFAPARYIRNSVTAIVFSVVCAYLFGAVLGVRLPPGIFNLTFL